MPSKFQVSSNIVEKTEKPLRWLSIIIAHLRHRISEASEALAGGPKFRLGSASSAGLKVSNPLSLLYSLTNCKTVQEIKKC